MDYAFSLIEMRFPSGSNKGDGKLEIELYGQQPRLMPRSVARCGDDRREFVYSVEASRPPNRWPASDG